MDNQSNQINTPPPDNSKVKTKNPKNLFKILFITSFVVSLVIMASEGYFLYTKNQENNNLNQQITDNMYKANTLQQENNKLLSENETLTSAISELNNNLEQMRRELYELQNPAYFTNYFPIQYRFENYQKLGQSFSINETQTITGLKLTASFGVGDDFFVTLYQASNPDEISSDNKLISVPYNTADIVKEKEFEVLFDTPIELQPNVNYLFIIETKDTFTQTSIAFAEADIDESGKMYKYTRLIGGNGEIISNSHSWQSSNTNDAIFSLIQTEPAF